MLRSLVFLLRREYTFLVHIIVFSPVGVIIISLSIALGMCTVGTLKGLKFLMMTPIVFEQWCEQLGLALATRKLLAGIRCSPPVRRVTSRAKNVSGTYPSSKMNKTIQFESQVEQRAILVME